MADVLPLNLPPAEAVEYFRRKGLRTSFDWQDVYAEEHARVFTVAKVMQLDILEDIRAQVDRAIAEGTTLQEFRRELTPTLQKKGWWGNQLATDPLDGEEKMVQLGSPRRLDTIYDTNLRSAYAAGRWEQIERTKGRRPYLRYVAILDERTRPRHRTWHGTVLAADDPFWQTHFPPNGWRCRCNVQQLSQRDLERYGYKVAPGGPSTLTSTYQNPRTGRVRQVPVGIDPGFEHNPGAVAGRARAHALLTEKLESTAAAAGDVARASVRDLVRSEAFTGFLEAPAGNFPVMVVPDLIREAIGAQGRVAVLSTDSLLKNRTRHPELGAADYQALPDVGEHPLLVVQDSATSVVIVARAGDLLWTVVKATRSGDEMFVTSVRSARDSSVGRLVRRKGARVLLDAMEGRRS